MYDPFAVDRMRIDEELIRHRLAAEPRRPERAPRRAAARRTAGGHLPAPRLRLALDGLLRRDRPACADC
jgi:hypothetical protein